MFSSLLKLTTDLVRIATAPVEIAADITRIVTEPIAEAAEDTVESVKDAVE